MKIMTIVDTKLDQNIINEQNVNKVKSSSIILTLKNADVVQKGDGYEVKI